MAVLSNKAFSLYESTTFLYSLRLFAELGNKTLARMNTNHLKEKLRAKFGLPAEPCHDCCVHFCCESCALCQEHAELKARGFDPSRG
ncbi:hypothetical protein Golob_016089 [Gossypium lobatum]|uniref:Uncharacterized protein n=1 Tax=Gossypium lobatum TaxID=34289 RepID=A0A7J8M335_9ROSI|nr:hypothetical protein [Gossypium lobatum]